jgi:uroporphyrinogen-III decarboxylase
MHPDFYRAAIFPRYKRLWAPLREAGKVLLFCSDATFTEFLPDLAAARADGFIFEPMTSLEAVVEAYGSSHVIISSKVDCRTLTFGTQPQIAAEVDATLALAARCPGFIFAVGNHIPSNVPIDNARFYMDYVREGWQR